MAGCDTIASDLLNKCTLRVRNVVSGEFINFRITEVEVYFHSAVHPDPFVHCHCAQQQTGAWYWHCASAAINSYRGGTFKGLDLTVGDGQSYGGILFRGIVNIGTGKREHGPSKTVDAILAAAGVNSIAEFVAVGAISSQVGPLLLISNPTTNLIIPQSVLPLKNVTNPTSLTAPAAIYRSPRYGLSFKKATAETISTYISYIAAPYRYLIWPSSDTKLKKAIELTMAYLINPPSDIIDTSQDQTWLGIKPNETQIQTLVRRGFA